MAAMKDYALGCPAEEYYQHLTRDRQVVIDTAREMAEITIPSVYPPDGYKTGDNIAENNQSIGALCVNTLASKLMFMAMSPYRPILRFQPIEHKLRDEIEQDPSAWDMVQVGLSQLEIEHRNRLEATQTRSTYVGASKQLLVAGNVLWEHMDINHPVYHKMDCYGVKRNSKGEPLCTVLEGEYDFEDLDDDVQDLVRENDPDLLSKYPKEYQCRVTIYRVCRRRGTSPKDYYWEYWEEFKGELIPGTEFEAKYEEPPLFPAWLIPVFGQNWGRSYCEEYRGDLKKVEALSSAINDGSAAASILWLFLNPGSRTSMRQLKQAENLALMVGKGTDVEAFKLDKQADFQFVANDLEKTVQRLGRAFLLMSSIQRDAERVTAEEWGKMAQEIDEAMGGLYSQLGQSFQSLVIRRFVALHHDEDKQLPKLPPGLFRVAIISAIDAMGRALEGQALTRATTTILSLFKEAALEYIDPLSFIRRIYSSEAVSQYGLVKSQEIVEKARAQMKQDAMKANLMDKAAGPVAGALAKTAGDGMLAQAGQQPPPDAGSGAPPSPGEADQVSPPPAS